MFKIIDINNCSKYYLDMANVVQIGKSIKDKRLALNLRMDDVAKKANITRATLWEIEKGRKNYSFFSLLKVLQVLDISLELNTGCKNKPTIQRAKKANLAIDKKINRFVIMCIEQFASYKNISSKEAYLLAKERGAIDLLTRDYEDLHAMSNVYLNDFIDSIINKDHQCAWWHQT